MDNNIPRVTTRLNRLKRKKPYSPDHKTDLERSDIKQPESPSISPSESSQDESYSPSEASHSENNESTDINAALQHTLDKKSFGNFSKIRSMVKNDEPCLASLLSANILDEDKMELFQLYEIYNNYSDISIDKFDLKKRIKDFFEKAKIKYKQYHKYTKAEHDAINKELILLNSYNDQEELKYDIVNLPTSQANKRVIYTEYKRMCRLSPGDDEYTKIKNWLTWALMLPYDKIHTVSYNSCELTKFLQHVQASLNRELYGMNKVKEQILLFLNSRIKNPNMKRCSLGLIGPPGCGKTTIVRLLADILGFNLQQISLGGVQSSDFLKGHQSVFIGSGPGEITRCMTRMGVKNGILFFDEFDKISNNPDVCSALLHITDNSQNSRFRDTFLNGIDIDLSMLWFMYSMNSLPTDEALAERVFYVYMQGFTPAEKFIIVKNFILRKIHENIGIPVNSVIFSDEAIEYLINRTKEEQGVRALENMIVDIMNKINFLYTHSRARNSFNLTFKLPKPVVYPFKVDKNIIDILLG